MPDKHFYFASNSASAEESDPCLNSEQRQQRAQHREHLENQITELAAHIHAATFRLLELIREFDEQEGWGGTGILSCAHWLNWKCGMSIGVARERVRVAHALKELPMISKVFRKGKISYSKVRAITRVATPKNEDYLLMIAAHGTAAHVERLVRNYRSVKRIEALELENQRHLQRELSWYVDEEGCWVLKGRFTPEQGALIQNALENAMEEEFQEQAKIPAGISEESENECQPRAEPVSSRRADALLRLAGHYTSGHASASSCHERFVVNIHTDIDTLKATGSGAEAELEDGANLSFETARRVSCDTGVVHWLDQNGQGHKGQALSVGRKTRSVPPTIRRALMRRDGGCCFPGCTCRRFVDAHHIHHWADGGETSLENLVLLCRRHHRLVHEGGFGLQRLPDGTIQFTDAKGKIIPTCPNKNSRGNAESLFATHEENGIRITPESAQSRWLGEKMDDQLAVEGLIYRE